MSKLRSGNHESLTFLQLLDSLLVDASFVQGGDVGSVFWNFGRLRVWNYLFTLHVVIHLFLLAIFFRFFFHLLHHHIFLFLTLNFILHYHPLMLFVFFLTQAFNHPIIWRHRQADILVFRRGNTLLLIVCNGHLLSWVLVPRSIHLPRSDLLTAANFVLDIIFNNLAFILSRLGRVVDGVFNFIFDFLLDSLLLHLDIF